VLKADCRRNTHAFGVQACRRQIVGDPDLSSELGQQIKCLGFSRTGVRGGQYSKPLASTAVVAQRVCEWQKPAAPYKGHHDVDCVRRLDLGQDLPAHSGLARRIRQQRCIQQRDQWSERHTDRSVRPPLSDPVQLLTRCQWNSLDGVTLRNPRADLAQQPSNHVDTNGYAISVRNGIKSSTKQPCEMLRDPIGGVR
jgi:hypothetical protein